MGVQLPSPAPMSNELIVPEGTNLIINDTPYPDDSVRSLFDDLTPVAKVKWLILSATEMTRELGAILTPALLGATFLFPGEGSQYIKSRLNLEGYNIITSRRFIGNRPSSVEVQVPPPVIEAVENSPTPSVTIIDDVIATGETVESIRREVEWDMRYPPRVLTWSVYCWLKQWSAKMPDIEVVSCIVYKRKSGRVPLNSLSTIMSTTNKGAIVRSSYAQRYFADPTEFIIALKQLETYA